MADVPIQRPRSRRSSPPYSCTTTRRRPGDQRAGRPPRPGRLALVQRVRPHPSGPGRDPRRDLARPARLDRHHPSRRRRAARPRWGSSCRTTPTPPVRARRARTRPRRARTVHRFATERGAAPRGRRATVPPRSTAPALVRHHPDLYRLTTTLPPRARQTAAESRLVGIRTFASTPTGLSVQREPRELKGVCLHEDAGPLGMAVPRGVAAPAAKLEGMGCNAVRMAHNPHAPELYGCATRSGCTSSTRRSTSGRTPRTSGGRATTSTRRGTRATRGTSPSGTCGT